MPANLLTSVGTAQIIVVDSSGAASNAVTFTMTAPPMVVNSLSPISVTAGGGAFTLTVNGSGFLSPVAVLWNGSALPTTYISTNQVTATVSSPAINVAGTASIVLTSSGRASSPISFPILPPSAPLASFSNQRVTKSTPPATICAQPPPSSSFLTSDRTVYLYFEATITKNNLLSNDWLGPDGSVVEAGSWNVADGNFCFTGPQLGISDLPASRLGQWQARIYDRGMRLFSVPFTVSAPAGGEAPIVSPNEIRNGAGFQQTISAGSWVQIKGTNLAKGSGRTWTANDIVEANQRIGSRRYFEWASTGGRDQ